MNFSYYEIYITSLRAFNGMGFPFGADEDAAFMTTWLELYRFQGIKKLAKLSKKIDKKFDAKIDLEKIKSSSLINIDHSSLLMKGPGLFDYFYQETKKNHYIKIILNNCIDPVFLIPLAQRLSEKLDFVSACWKNDKNKTIGIKIIKNKTLVGELKSKIVPLKKQVFLQFSTNKKSSKIEKFNFHKIEYEINAKFKQQCLEKSLNPNADDWKIISKLAHRTFVPESEESRQKGAGGGDDND